MTPAFNFRAVMASELAKASRCQTGKRLSSRNNSISVIQYRRRAMMRLNEELDNGETIVVWKGFRL